MLTTQQRTELLEIARLAIEEGLAEGREPRIDTSWANSDLQQPAATFVTLNKDGQLRGCIGTLQARRPLIEDVAANGYAAAFHDPRFPPLERSELKRTTISISLLSTPEPLEVESEQELLKKLQPGCDGLILREGSRRATFLPAVWDQLPEPGQFLAQLKLKAGLPADYWSDDLHFERYFSESWSEQDATPARQ